MWLSHFGFRFDHPWTLPVPSLATAPFHRGPFVVVPNASEATCTSDPSNQDKLVRDLTSAVENLSLAAETLSRHVVQGSSATSSTVAVPVPVAEQYSDWEVVEEASFPNPRVAQDIASALNLRAIEEGPPEIPPACLDLARRRLTSVSVGAEQRARRAFKSGFWSKAAIDTVTKYTPDEPLADLKVCHWIVLRSGDRPPFRVANRADLLKLTEKDYDIVCETFASLAEVQIYCLGAQAPVPPLVKCRSQK